MGALARKHRRCASFKMSPFNHESRDGSSMVKSPPAGTLSEPGLAATGAGTLGRDSWRQGLQVLYRYLRPHAVRLQRQRYTAYVPCPSATDQNPPMGPARAASPARLVRLQTLHPEWQSPNALQGAGTTWFERESPGVKSFLPRASRRRSPSGRSATDHHPAMGPAATTVASSSLPRTAPV